MPLLYGRLRPQGAIQALRAVCGHWWAQPISRPYDKLVGASWSGASRQLVFSWSSWLGSCPTLFLGLWPDRQLVFSWRLCPLGGGPPPPSYQLA